MSNKTGKKKDLITVNINGKTVETRKNEVVKYEIADELGLLDRVLETGWKSLSARETGKIGGIMAGRNKKTENPINLLDNG